jgi:hypothetical protein
MQAMPIPVVFGALFRQNQLCHQLCVTRASRLGGVSPNAWQLTFTAKGKNQKGVSPTWSGNDADTIKALDSGDTRSNMCGVRARRANLYIK